MDSIIITWRELLLVLAAVLAVYVAEMLLLLRRGGNPGWRLWQRGAQAHAQARALVELRGQLEALRLETAQLRTRLDASSPGAATGAGAGDGSVADASAVGDASRVFRLGPGAPAPAGGYGSPDAADTPYGHAIRMAREGRAVAEVATDCGISRGEAELIVALYRSPSTH